MGSHGAMVPPTFLGVDASATDSLDISADISSLGVSAESPNSLGGDSVVSPNFHGSGWWWGV